MSLASALSRHFAIDEGTVRIRFPGVVMFVKSLKYGYYRFQFAQFGWAHMLILAIVTQAYILVCNIKEGLVWYAGL
jgi:hypothetical protein